MGQRGNVTVIAMGGFKMNITRGNTTQFFDSIIEKLLSNCEKYQKSGIKVKTYKIVRV